MAKLVGTLFNRFKTKLFKSLNIPHCRQSDHCFIVLWLLYFAAESDGYSRRSRRTNQ